MVLKKPEKLTKQSVDSINVLIYGDRGVGKTTFAASAADVPDLRDVLFLDVELGLISVAERGDLYKIRIENIAEATEVLWALATGHEDFKNIKTVVIDSVTALQEREVALVHKKHRRKPEEKNPLDWAEAAGPLRDLLRGLRAIPVNTVMTAGIKTLYDGVGLFDRGPMRKIIPDMSESTAEALVGYQDFAFVLVNRTDNAGNITRFALTREFKKYRAKSRNARMSEAMGLWWPDPSMPALWELWKGGASQA